MTNKAVPFFVSSNSHKASISKVPFDASLLQIIKAYHYKDTPQLTNFNYLIFMHTVFILKNI
jgi:hypothetical protein